MSAGFDTLRFTQRLEQVGVAREQAIAHAELARDMIIEQVATKRDVQALKGNLDLLERALKADIVSLRAELTSEFTASRKETNGSLRELELRMTVKLGAMLAAAVAIMAALQKVL